MCGASPAHGVAGYLRSLGRFPPARTRRMDSPPITEAFAKEMLRALYRLDQPIARIDGAISNLPDGETKRQLVKMLGHVMDIVLSALMVPLYAAHPQLGRASEPGPWLQDAK